MKKGVWLFVLILVVGLGVFCYWKFYYTYSEGRRAGLLQKFSYKGQLFKTYEGELILSSVESNKNVTLASEKFFFSVADHQVADKLMTLEGSFIVIHYTEKNGALFWRGDTRFFVDSVAVKE